MRDGTDPYNMLKPKEYAGSFSRILTWSLPSPTRELLVVSVKRTTRLWRGSGSTRGSPSAAPPAVPITSWCPMSFHTELYIFMHTHMHNYRHTLPIPLVTPYTSFVTSLLTL
uniref:Uncharacterized protein n=1 Tax=Anguilla anguilla TaxID=7936 RepID=A0A0E9PUW5_ANGAN